MLKLKNLIFPILLIIFDALTLFILLLLIVGIRFALIPLIFPNVPTKPINIITYLPFVFVLILVFLYEGLYTKRFTFWNEVIYIWKSFFVSAILIIGLLFILKKSQEYSRFVILNWMFLSSLLLPIIRTNFKQILYKFNIGKEKVLILGMDKNSLEVLQILKKEKNLGYKVMGFIDINKSNTQKTIEGLKIHSNLIKLDRYLKYIDTLIVSDSIYKNKNLVYLINKALFKVKRIWYIPSLKEIPILGTEIKYFFREDLFALEIKNNLYSKLNYFLKRSFDYLISILLLPILLPIIVIISILIKITSKGPVFFSQERIGKNGKPFKCYKFRTMYEDAEQRLQQILEENPKLKEEWEKYRKLKNDPRITPIGKILRKTSLDEVPQIFNVLKGEMSLVGPRPVTKEELKKYYKDKIYYYIQVPPGITGLWQVSGRNNLDYSKRVALDVWYIRNWNLWLDLIILIKTIRTLFKREGAY